MLTQLAFSCNSVTTAECNTTSRALSPQVSSPWVFVDLVLGILGPQIPSPCVFTFPDLGSSDLQSSSFWASSPWDLGSSGLPVLGFLCPQSLGPQIPIFKSSVLGFSCPQSLGPQIPISDLQSLGPWVPQSLGPRVSSPWVFRPLVLGTLDPQVPSLWVLESPVLGSSSPVFVVSHFEMLKRWIVHWFYYIPVQDSCTLHSKILKINVMNDNVLDRHPIWVHI